MAKTVILFELDKIKVGSKILWGNVAQTFHLRKKIDNLWQFSWETRLVGGENEQTIGWIDRTGIKQNKMISGPLSWGIIHCFILWKLKGE